MTRILRIAISAGLCLMACACSKKENFVAELSASKSQLSYESSGSEQILQISANTYWRAFLPEGCDWINVYPMGSAAGNTEISVTVTANMEEVPRQAKIVFETADGTSATLGISQEERTIPLPTATDLNDPAFYGESGASRVYTNCFLLSEAGEYCFEAADSEGKTVLGSSATWVWATSGLWSSSTECVLENLITDVSLVEGLVGFTIPEGFTPGNVILAVVDESGLIQGSWHIWTAKGMSDIKAAETDWMDRNLGACGVFDPQTGDDCNAARGFYYQWGCKNPQIGPYDSKTMKGDAFTPGKGATYYVYNSAVLNAGEWDSISIYPENWTNSAADAMRYPTSIIGTASKTPTYGSKADWPQSANPCPHGYTLPTRQQMADLGNATILNDPDEALKNVAIERSGVVFPSCGYRNGAGVIAVAANPDMRYWVAEAMDGSKRYYWLANKSNNKENTAGTDVGMSVRCVRIK